MASRYRRGRRPLLYKYADVRSIRIRRLGPDRRLLTFMYKGRPRVYAISPRVDLGSLEDLLALYSSGGEAEARHAHAEPVSI